MDRSRRIALAVVATLASAGAVYSLIALDVIHRQPLLELKTSRDHPMQYYVSLPEHWNPSAKWPILVTVDGANCEFLKNARMFVRARKGLPFIIVTPIVLSNVGERDRDLANYHYAQEVWDEVANRGNMSFDEKGVAAVIHDVQVQFNGGEQFFITGWSGGGNLTWFMVYTHPENLAGAVLACGNYFGQGVETVSSAPERVHLPVKAYQGAHDPALVNLTKQWETARNIAQANGYRNLVREIIKDAGHEAFPDQVFEFCASLLPPD